jgi:hypothetical protein
VPAIIRKELGNVVVLLIMLESTVRIIVSENLCIVNRPLLTTFK